MFNDTQTTDLPRTSPPSALEGSEGKCAVSKATLSPFLHVDWAIKKYEVVCILFAITVAVLVSLTPLPFSHILANYFILRLQKFVVLVYALSLVVIFVKAQIYKSKHKINPFRNEQALLEVVQPYFTPNFFINTVRRGVAILTVIYFFLHLKHVVFFLHSANYDLLFWNLDRLVHFGVQPNIYLMERFGTNDELAITIDWIYSFAYFKYIIYAAVFFLLELRGRELTEKFFLAYTLLWSLGGLSYLIMPADGPCYALLGRHSVPHEAQVHVVQFPVTSDIPKTYEKSYNASKVWLAKNKQEDLWSHRKAFLVEHKLPNMFYGIAAMPSLHVAAVFMVMVFFFCVSPYLGLFGLCAVGVMWFGSVFLQWHYAIDGYAGMALSSLVCFISLKWGGTQWNLHGKKNS